MTIPTAPLKLAKGDRVRVTYEGKTVYAEVKLASSNGQSLVLNFPDAMLGGYVETMPVLWRWGSYTDLIAAQTVVIEKETRSR